MHHIQVRQLLSVITMQPLMQVSFYTGDGKEVAEVKSTEHYLWLILNLSGKAIFIFFFRRSSVLHFSLNLLLANKL